MPFAEPVSDSLNTSSLFLAEVVSTEGQHLTCERNGRAFLACKGTSLLIDPLPGDQVAVMEPEEGLFFVIAIVSSQHNASPRNMTFQNGIAIRAPKGNIAVCSPEGVRIEAGTLDVKGTSCRTRFSDLTVEASRTTITSDLISLVARKVEQIAHTVETVAHWISVRAHMATKEVATLDRSASGQTLIESETVLSIQSKTTIVNSSEWVKIDSDQIHLG